MELGHDSPEIPIGMLTNHHLRRCKSLVSRPFPTGNKHSKDAFTFNSIGEETLLHFVEKLKSMKETGPKAVNAWYESSQIWFTLMPSTRPFTFRDHADLAEHVSVISRFLQIFSTV